MKGIRVALVTSFILMSLGPLAPTASAKYTLHNSSDMTETDVIGGSEYNTCGDRISGRSAWSDDELLDPLEGPDLAAATSPANYEVFQFPPGSDPSLFELESDAATGTNVYVMRDIHGDIVQTAPLVLAFTTAPRVLFPGGPIVQDGRYLYSSVGFDGSISPPAPVGSILGIKPTGVIPTRRDLTVVDCSAPGVVVAQIDAQPLSSKNKVNPASRWPTLVILVQGSADLEVEEIATAAVGSAAPLIKGVFGSLSTPVDLTGDGRKDRLYFFRPYQTGLTCSSTEVVIGGLLQGGGGWTGSDQITPVGC